MSANVKSTDGSRIKKEVGAESQFAEADSSTNSTAAHTGAEEVTRHSNLQRIQMKKEKV